MKWYNYLLCWLLVVASALVIVVALVDLVLMNTGNDTILFKMTSF